MRAYEIIFSYYGFHGVVIDWIISLRALNLLIITVIIHLFVAFRVVFLKASCGVPQGFILILFFLCNTLTIFVTFVLNGVDVILFTDYTNLLFPHSDPAY